MDQGEYSQKNPDINVGSIKQMKYTESIYTCKTPGCSNLNTKTTIVEMKDHPEYRICNCCHKLLTLVSAIEKTLVMS